MSSQRKKGKNGDMSPPEGRGDFDAATALKSLSSDPKKTSGAMLPDDHVVIGDAPDDEKVLERRSIRGEMPHFASTSPHQFSSPCVQAACVRDKRKRPRSSSVGDEPSLPNEYDGIAKLSSRLSDCSKSFPEKLMEMLDDHSNHDIISWHPRGGSFFIHDPYKLTGDLLRRYNLKRCKFESFTRKLYFWGFRKISHGADTDEFFNKMFKRGDTPLCKHIRCRTEQEIAAAESPATQEVADSRRSCSPVQTPRPFSENAHTVETITMLQQRHERKDHSRGLLQELPLQSSIAGPRVSPFIDPRIDKKPQSPAYDLRSSGILSMINRNTLFNRHNCLVRTHNVHNNEPTCRVTEADPRAAVARQDTFLDDGTSALPGISSPLLEYRELSSLETRVVDTGYCSTFLPRVTLRSTEQAQQDLVQRNFFERNRVLGAMLLHRQRHETIRDAAMSHLRFTAQQIASGPPPFTGDSEATLNIRRSADHVAERDDTNPTSSFDRASLPRSSFH